MANIDMKRYIDIRNDIFPIWQNYQRTDVSMDSTPRQIFAENISAEQKKLENVSQSKLFRFHKSSSDKFGNVWQIIGKKTKEFL